MREILCHTCRVRADGTCSQPPDLLGKCGYNSSGQPEGCEWGKQWIVNFFVEKGLSGPYTLVIEDNGESIKAFDGEERLAQVVKGNIWPRKIKWSP